MPSIFWPDCRTSSACLPPVPNCQPVKVCLTTFMPGLALMASMKPSWRAVSAGAPEMPRISRMLPLPPSFLASHSPPSLPYCFWSLVTFRTSGESIAWSTEMIFTPRRLASAMTELSAVASAGLMMIALAPEEIRLRIAAICSGAAPFWLETRTFETWPLAAACALTAQIISSRQPLPTSVLETPIVYFWLPLPELPLEPLLELSDPLPHAATTAASASAISAPLSFLLTCMSLLLGGLRRRDRRRTGDCAAQRPREAVRMLGIGAGEELGRPAGPDEGGTRDDRWQGSPGMQGRRGPHLELVGHRHRGDGRARSDGRLEPRDRHERVARWRAEVEHHVGVVEQARP